MTTCMFCSTKMEAWPDIFPLKKKNIMQLCKESKYMSFQGDNH